MSSRPSRGDPNKLMAGARPGFPNGAKTALMSAAETGNAAKVAALVDDGKADVGITNEHGLTALHFASTPEAARALVERGADMNALAKELEFSAPSASPLVVAIRRDDVKMVKALIALGASADSCESYPYDRCTSSPLKRCFGRNGGFKKEVLAALLEAGADVDGTAGATPLHVAIERESLEGVRMLCDAGADLTITCGAVDAPQAFETPLAFAIRVANPFIDGDSSIVAELRARGAPLA